MRSYPTRPRKTASTSILRSFGSLESSVDALRGNLERSADLAAIQFTFKLDLQIAGVEFQQELAVRECPGERRAAGGVRAHAGDLVFLDGEIQLELAIRLVGDFSNALPQTGERPALVR